MELLGNTKKYVDKGKDGEVVPRLESVEVVLVHCNLLKNDYQHISKVLYSSEQNICAINKYFIDEEHS